jgi:proteasome accessory factor B
MRFHNLVKNGQYPNCSALAREFEVSIRTIMRDLDFMRDRLKLPLQFDSRRNGFAYTRPVEHFPQVAVSQAEMFSLLVAHKAIAQYHGTPFEQPLEMAFRRLSGYLDRSVAYSLGNLNEVLSFRPFAPEDADLETFQSVTRALNERRELKFLYRNLGAEKAHWRRVRPYHLACVDNHWYLFAFDVKRNALRTFALTRLRTPQLTRKHFTVPKTFDLNEYLRGSFSIFKGGDDYEVVVDFDSWAADLVRGRRWHSSQEVTELPGRQVRLRLRLNSLEEAERWVLSWGTHATVVRPQTLASRIYTTAAALRERYLALPLPADTSTDRPNPSPAPVPLSFFITGTRNARPADRQS